MKIAVYSDLHLETLRRHPEWAVIPKPQDDDTLIVLAGDIHTGTQGLKALAAHGEGHIYVPGNHEYYHHDVEILDEQMLSQGAKYGLHVLQRSSTVVEGVRFLGTTLWTDFKIQPAWSLGARLVANAFLPDYKLIRYRGKVLNPQLSVHLHEQNIEWLTGELKKPFQGKTVVITHHAPHPLSIHQRFDLSPINAAFVSNLEHLLDYCDLWIHGHMHDSFDYRLNNDRQTRVIANPRGYLRKAPKNKTAQFENAHFNHHLILEI